MNGQGAETATPIVADKPQWRRISEDEARAAAGDEAIDKLLADVGAKGRASAERYRAAGHTVIDQT